MAELQNEVVYLPQYFSENISEEDIENLNGYDSEVYLYFAGQNDKTK